jgi:hypothetical protein
MIFDGERIFMNTTDKEVSARSYIWKEHNEKNRNYQGTIDSIFIIVSPHTITNKYLHNKIFVHHHKSYCMYQS